MNRQLRVREIGARIPGELRQLRGRMLLSGFAAHMGVGEVRCTACGGAGTLDTDGRERCPICMGFQEVPRMLDAWFQEQMLSLLESGRDGSPPWGAKAEPSRAPARLGLAAELTYRVSESDLFEPCGADGA